MNGLIQINLSILTELSQADRILLAETSWYFTFNKQGVALLEIL